MKPNKVTIWLLGMSTIWNIGKLAISKKIAYFLGPFFISLTLQLLVPLYYCQSLINNTSLQPFSRPVEQISYYGKDFIRLGFHLLLTSQSNDNTYYVSRGLETGLETGLGAA